MAQMRRAACSLVLATFAMSIVPTTARAQQRALFSDDSVLASSAGAANGDPTVVRSRRASADLSLIAAAGQGAATGFGATQRAARSIALNLFSDVDLIAQLDHVELVQPVGYAWVGEVVGVSGSNVVLAVSGGTLTGSIEAGGKLYSVRRVDQAYANAERERPQIAGDDIAVAPRDGRAAVAAGASAGAAATDSGDVFDLLLYYTAAVKNAIGGADAVNSFIAGSIARVNSAYAASNISTRVRLVAALETPYVESGSTATDLPALRD